MKTRSILLALFVAAGFGHASATVLYGFTTTSMEEGNARLVCFDTDDLSDDPASPTQLTELATVESANDFMGGCAMGEFYYGYYNITDMETQTVVQYFCCIDFATGNAEVLASVDPTMSSDGIYLIDMTYEPVSGLLVALENQYSPSQNAILGTLHAVHPDKGTLSKLHDFDRKFSAICADGAGGYYLAEIERQGDGVGLPVFYKADRDFKVSDFIPPKPSLKAESGMAHSMILDGGKLYLVTGRTVTVADLATRATTSYYLDRDLYGVSASRGQAGLESAVDNATIRLQGSKVLLDREGDADVFGIDGRHLGAFRNCREISLAAWSPGVYIVQVSSEGVIKTLKLRI